MDPATAARYGMGGRGMMSQAMMMSRYGINPGGAAAAQADAPSQATGTSTPAPKTGTKTFVDEKSLKVTLTIHSIRLNPARPDKPEKKAPRPPPSDAAPTETPTP